MLQDTFGRQIAYVRLSVTDHCDLHCSYCKPRTYHDYDPPEEWLSFDEIERIIRLFSELGTHRVRITGGEPLTRKNLPTLAARLAALPAVDDLSLSTNAVQLSRHARALYTAGISRVNISLDSLRPERFAAITGGGKLDKVLAGIAAAADAGFAPIKINMVVMGGVNDDEVEDIVHYCLERNFTLRFIETMPIGDTGRNASRRFVSLKEIESRLSTHFDLVPAVMSGGGPARYVKIANTSLRIGFITPISQHFCESCNRVRLAANGRLHLCLGQEDSVDLRTPLRTGASDTEIRAIITEAVARKPARHEFCEKPGKIIRFMSQTGG